MEVNPNCFRNHSERKERVPLLISSRREAAPEKGESFSVTRVMRYQKGK